jgi:hypothetical protein
MMCTVSIVYPCRHNTIQNGRITVFLKNNKEEDSAEMPSGTMC